MGHDKHCNSDDEKHCDFDIIKKMLVKDPYLQLDGVQAYINVYSTISQTIHTSESVRFEKTQQALNIDHTPGFPEVVIRMDGLYYIMYTMESSESCQITFFINANPVHSTTSGISSGAGQLMQTALLPMKNGDILTVRNYRSSVTPLTILPNIGGTIQGTNTEMVVLRTSPYPYDSAPSTSLERRYEERQCEYELNDKERHLFKKWTKKLLKDPKFMLRGSDAFGSFYSDSIQTVSLNSPVLFKKTAISCGLNIQNDCEVVIQKSGIYMFVFLVGTTQSAQFTVFVNGNPDLTTTAGINKGGGQLALRQSLQLNVGDRVSVCNYLSNAGDVNLTANGGGTEVGVNPLLYIIRVASIPLLCEEGFFDIDCNIEKIYKKFRYYLNNRKDVLTKFSDDSIISINSDYQELVPGSKVLLNENTYLSGIYHNTHSTDFVVKRSGYYKVHFIGQYNQPSQFTLFVNDVPNPTTVTGTDSGSGSQLLMQIVKLNKGDVVNVRNHTSFTVPVTSQLNPGGYERGTNAVFLLMLLSIENCC